MTDTRLRPPLLSHRLLAQGRGAATVLGLLALGACQPTVRVEPPKEPITINLNIKLDANVRVQLEKQAEEDIKANPDIF
ncbi:MAG: YnbE family lipoprotein [Alphaproteobacteria bacterium]|nr:MAG: YnbE family lipoprotein [Alphaproteobacteria bacterium]